MTTMTTSKSNGTVDVPTRDCKLHGVMTTYAHFKVLRIRPWLGYVEVEVEGKIHKLYREDSVTVTKETKIG